jgi:hypothetical protein
MKIKPAIQKQINQVKIWLIEGLTTQQIENKFAQIYTDLHYSKKTIANRIKQAKLQTQPLLDDDSKKIDIDILKREKEAKKRIKNAYIAMVEFQAGIMEDLAMVMANTNDPLKYLVALKTAQKNGVQIKDLASSLRLENGLPNVISKNENQTSITEYKVESNLGSE